MKTTHQGFILPLSACAIGVCTVLAPNLAHGFAEEPFTSPRHSTIHQEVVEALAVCAGYSTTQAESLSQWSEVPDTLTISGGPDFCQGTLGSVPATPLGASLDGATLTDLVPGWWNGCNLTSLRVVPSSIPAAGAACLSDRFGGFLDLFHYPSNAQVSELRDWAFTGDPIVSDRIAAYGGIRLLPVTWQCLATWPGETPTLGGGLDAGDSLEAFGIYLHALADSYSHNDCIEDVATSSSLLDVPVHHGSWRSDLCSYLQHVDELSTDTTGLSEYPVYRTLEAVIGHDGADWLYGGSLPYATSFYGFDGLYAEILAWRDDHPGEFVGAVAPLEIDLTDPDYQTLLMMVDDLIFGNSGTGAFFNSAGRASDASDIETFCAAL